MKLVTVLLALTSLALGTLDSDFSTRSPSCDLVPGNWHPPTYGDIRGPCPLLNSRANHCFLPHDGKAITMPMVVTALTGAVNISREIATGLALGALRLSSHPASGTWQLDDLSRRPGQEHDGSLSRGDFPGDNHSFNLTVFNEYLGYFHGKARIDVKDAAAARWGRLTCAKKTNKNFQYLPNDRFNSYTESAVLLLTLGNRTSGLTRVDWIKVLFEEERLPYVEGWVTPPVFDGFAIAAQILNLALATGERLDGLPSTGEAGADFSHS